MKITAPKVVSVVALIVIAKTAIAHEGATGVVKERMDGMSEMAAALKAIAPMVNGQSEYDPALIRNAAEILQQHAGENLTNLFTEDSKSMVSQASETVWEKPEEFVNLALQLDLYARGLAIAAENNPSTDAAIDVLRPLTLDAMAELPVNAIFAEIGRTCSACHEGYRERK